MFNQDIMRILLFLITVFICTKISQQQFEVNEGASTSRQDIARCEECEVQNYATSMARLMLAEDLNGGDLMDMVNNRPDELYAFYDEVFSYITLAQRGARAVNDEVFATRRRTIFGSHFRSFVASILITASFNHYNYSSWYVYDNERNMIVVHENLNAPPSDQCLCGHFEERRILENPGPFPHISILLLAYQVNANRHEVTVYETTQYHVIPLSLIKKFLSYWLSDVEDADCYGNLCAKTLYYRFRRSINKLILTQIRETDQLRNRDTRRLVVIQSSENDRFSIDIVAHASSWLSGNIFLGPRNRGPLDPRYGRNAAEAANEFDVDAQYILEREHFQSLQLLYRRLQIFMNPVSRSFSLHRLLDGFNIFLSITEIIVGRSITPLNNEQWEERYPNHNELLRMRLNERQAAQTKKFWGIKRPPSRFPRSVDENEIDMSMPNHKSKMFSQKDLWTEFVDELMTLSLVTHGKKEPPVWFCNFTRLFDDYLKNDYFKKKEPITDDLPCPKCTGLDEYLYSQLLSSEDWIRCNDITKNNPAPWCIAWINIAKDMKKDMKYSNEKSNKEYFVKKTRSMSFMKNIEIFLHWLALKLESNKKIVEDQITLPVFKHDPYLPTKLHSDTTSIVLCYLTTFSMNLIRWKSDCPKIG